MFQALRVFVLLVDDVLTAVTDNGSGSHNDGNVSCSGRHDTQTKDDDWRYIPSKFGIHALIACVCLKSVVGIAGFVYLSRCP